MSTQLLIILSACLCTAVGVFAFLRKGGLSKKQQQQILDSHTDAQGQIDQAEGEAQTALQQSAQEAQDSLRSLSERERLQRQALENADTQEQVILQADKVRRRWNRLKNNIQSPWLVGLLVLLFAFVRCAPIYAAKQTELLTKIKELSLDLNDCVNAIEKQTIIHKKKLRDKDIHTKRRLKQKDAALTQCRKEILVYRGKAPNNTLLVVGITLTSAVAVTSIALLFVSILKPEVFGNKRGNL